MYLAYKRSFQAGLYYDFKENKKTENMKESFTFDSSSKEFGRDFLKEELFKYVVLWWSFDISSENQIYYDLNIKRFNSIQEICNCYITQIK